MPHEQATPRFVPEIGQYVLYHAPSTATGLAVARADRVLLKTVVEHLPHRDRKIPVDRVMGCFDDYDRAIDVMLAVRKSHAEDGPVEAKRLLDAMMAETDTSPALR